MVCKQTHCTVDTAATTKHRGFGRKGGCSLLFSVGAGGQTHILQDHKSDKVALATGFSSLVKMASMQLCHRFCNTNYILPIE